MSKYEERAESIKAEAESCNFRISWAMRPSGLFVTLKNDGDKTLDDMRRFVRTFYPNADMTSGGWSEATFNVKRTERLPKDPVIPMNNAVHLDFHWQTDEDVRAGVRANAVFIQAKLVAAGVDAKVAAEAVQDLFEAGHREGYEHGYESGSDQIGPLGDESYRD